MEKIAFFEIENWEKDYIKKSLGKHKLFFFNDELNKKKINKIKDMDILAVFIYSKINKEILDALPKLKLIATMSTGFDHIDIEEAKKKKIDVCNVPYYGENTVAEHTFALILALSRKIIDSVNRAKQGDFTLKGLRGFDLKDKIIGIVGGGHIGMHVARMANGFEMKTLVYDIHKDKNLAKKYNFKYASFDSLLKNSDIITLHAPLNKYTEHMINSKNINKIKKGALLINTARGGLVETEAIIKALDKGILSGAGLDVLEGECFIKEEKQLLDNNFAKECDLRTQLRNHILLKNNKCIITSHNAFNSKEALQRILDTTIENIKAFLKKKPINKVIR